MSQRFSETVNQNKLLIEWSLIELWASNSLRQSVNRTELVIDWSLDYIASQQFSEKVSKRRREWVSEQVKSL
jgi:hypothetical protein